MFIQFGFTMNPNCLFGHWRRSRGHVGLDRPQTPPTPHLPTRTTASDRTSRRLFRDL